MLEQVCEQQRDGAEALHRPDQQLLQGLAAALAPGLANLEYKEEREEESNIRICMFLLDVAERNVHVRAWYYV